MMKTALNRLASLTAALLLTAAASAADRPNILWISCEDMSPNLAAYGDPLAHTPTLNALARQGTTYKRAFATSPVCSASRSAIITGMYPASFGAQHHRSSVPLPDGVDILPTYLREAGYYCTNNAKTDYNFPMPDNAWHDSSNKAHWRNRPDSAQPFFSVFNFNVTHEGRVFLPEKKFLQETPDVSATRRLRPDQVTLPPYIPDTPTARADWARYYTMIAQLDVQVKNLLDELHADGLSTNTLVVFFSDHGMGMPRGKRWLYDTGLHVPLIIRWPGTLKPGSTNEELLTLADLAPTMLAVAGLERPAHMHGRAFLTGSRQPEPEFVFATRDRMDDVHDMSRSVRSRDFKYIRHFYPDRSYMMEIAYMEQNRTLSEMRTLAADGLLTGPATLYFEPGKPREELFDLRNDPWEIRNLAADNDYATTLTLMRRELDTWMEQIDDHGLQPETSDAKRTGAAAKKRQQRAREKQ